MNDIKRNNFKIIGDNSAAGGYYNDARIVGNSIVNGDLDCVNFKSVGDSKINGNLNSERIRVMGTISITGSSKSRNAVITGNLDAAGDINCRNLVLRGGISSEGCIKGNELKLKGYATIKKNCETERFKSDGQLTIDGLLNADDINIKVYGQSKVSEIGGDKIVVRKGSSKSVAKMVKFLFVPSEFHHGILQTNSIEGNEIRLANTKAKVVRGRNIIIDDGCEIDLVEYEDRLQVSKGSSVKEQKKTH